MHDWEDAFELAREDGVLVWEYESRDEFERARDGLRGGGWAVDEIKDIRHPVGTANRGLLSRASALAKPKGLRVTFRPRDRRNFRDWTSANILQPRMRLPQPSKNGTGVENGAQEHDKGAAGIALQEHKNGSFKNSNGAANVQPNGASGTHANGASHPHDNGFKAQAMVATLVRDDKAPRLEHPAPSASGVAFLLPGVAQNGDDQHDVYQDVDGSLDYSYDPE
jgi:hypothetical protein